MAGTSDLGEGREKTGGREECVGGEKEDSSANSGEVLEDIS